MQCSSFTMSPMPANMKATYACQVCHRAYERLDHLNRHLDSRNIISENLQPLIE